MRYRTQPAPVSGRCGRCSSSCSWSRCLGPLFAPYSPPTSRRALRSQGRRSDRLLGTDFLGRDVLSRVLDGESNRLLLAAAATIIAYLGRAAARPDRRLPAGSLLDPILMRWSTSFWRSPPLLFLLVIATGVGPRDGGARCAAVAVMHVRGSHGSCGRRRSRSRTQSYVEAAVVRGERTCAILLPRDPAEHPSTPCSPMPACGCTGSILLVAAVNYLGLGLQPPAADWALMISENRSGLDLQPLGTDAPAVADRRCSRSRVNLIADATAADAPTSGRRTRRWSNR